MKRRYPHARKGGNWQGQPYITYAEHDQCVRATFGLGPNTTREARRFAYNAAVQRLTAGR